MEATTRNLTAVALARAGFECENLAEASERLGVQDLAGLIAGSKTMQEAWARGRFLRQLGELAASPVCESVVAKRMGFDEAGFRAVLAADAECLDIWKQNRHRFFLQARALVMKSAEDGKAHAVRTIEQLLRSEAGVPGSTGQTDFHRLSLTELEVATGIRRQQILRWRERHGLPVNEDGTYSLPAFVGWLRKANVGKVRNYRCRPSAAERRIVARITSIVHEELSRQQGRESGGQ